MNENKKAEPGKSATRFQAITPGLGFHPFSDGLPYAPVSKTTTGAKVPSTEQTANPSSRGTTLNATPAPASGGAPASISMGAPMGGLGATAAGPATFGFPTPARPNHPNIARGNIPAPRVSVPVANPGPSLVPGGPAGALRPSSPAKPKPTRPAAEPARSAVPTPAATFAAHRYGFVYLLKRTVAYLIDSALNCALLAGGLSLALWNQDLGPELLTNPGVIVISGLFFALFNWALITAQEIAFGTSVGKRVFGLALQGSTSAIFLRAFFFLPSLGFCAIGLLWGLLDRQKRCWHDLVVNVQPLEIAKL